MMARTRRRRGTLLWSSFFRNLSPGCYSSRSEGMASLEEHCYVLVFANFPGMLFVEEWLRRRTGEGQR
ncbi:unnamed protein product, partial [Ilex paraguariensis]